MREQLLRLFCLAMGLRLFACLVLGLGSGMQGWGSRSWRRFAELKNATSNGSSCVLLYLLVLLLLRGWLGISSSQRGGLAALGVAGVYSLRSLRAFPLCPAASRHGLTFVFAASLFLPHTLSLSPSLSLFFRSQRRRLRRQLLSTDGGVNSLLVGVLAD